MKCPNCKHEMEKGALADSTSWVKGLWAKLASHALLTEKVFAYRCSKCGKVELTTKNE